MPRTKNAKNKNPLKGKAVSKPLSTPLKVKLPTLKTIDGYELPLTTQDLEGIEDMVSIGASASYVAYQLGVSEGELNMAIRNSDRLKEAVKRGRARDEMEIVDLVREQIKKGNMVAAIWYQKNKHGWKDNDKGQGSGSIVVNVSTGINRESSASPRVVSGLESDNDGT